MVNINCKYFHHDRKLLGYGYICGNGMKQIRAYDCVECEKYDKAIDEKRRCINCVNYNGVHTAGDSFQYNQCKNTYHVENCHEDISLAARDFATICSCFALKEEEKEPTIKSCDTCYNPKHNHELSECKVSGCLAPTLEGWMGRTPPVIKLEKCEHCEHCKPYGDHYYCYALSKHKEWKCSGHHGEYELDESYHDCVCKKYYTNMFEPKPREEKKEEPKKLVTNCTIKCKWHHVKLIEGLHVNWCGKVNKQLDKVLQEECVHVILDFYNNYAIGCRCFKDKENTNHPNPDGTCGYSVAPPPTIKYTWKEGEGIKIDPKEVTVPSFSQMENIMSQERKNLESYLKEQLNDYTKITRGAFEDYVRIEVGNIKKQIKESITKNFEDSHNQIQHQINSILKRFDSGFGKLRKEIGDVYEKTKTYLYAEQLKKEGEEKGIPSLDELSKVSSCEKCPYSHADLCLLRVAGFECDDHNGRLIPVPEKSCRTCAYIDECASFGKQSKKCKYEKFEPKCERSCIYYHIKYNPTKGYNQIWCGRVDECSHDVSSTDCIYEESKKEQRCIDCTHYKSEKIPRCSSGNASFVENFNSLGVGLYIDFADRCSWYHNKNGVQ